MFEIQQNHSKTRNLVIGDKIKKYLLSFDISLKMKQTIFKLQCKMEDTKENYKTFYINDMSCTFCEKQHTIDSFKHYLEECLYFRTNVTFRNKVHNIEYMDAFRNLDKQIEIAKLWLEIEEHRNIFREKCDRKV